MVPVPNVTGSPQGAFTWAVVAPISSTFSHNEQTNTHRRPVRNTLNSKTEQQFQRLSNKLLTNEVLYDTDNNEVLYDTDNTQSLLDYS